jgi:hypothetical protein
MTTQYDERQELTDEQFRIGAELNLAICEALESREPADAIHSPLVVRLRRALAGRTAELEVVDNFESAALPTVAEAVEISRLKAEKVERERYLGFALGTLTVKWQETHETLMRLADNLHDLRRATSEVEACAQKVGRRLVGFDIDGRITNALIAIGIRLPRHLSESQIRQDVGHPDDLLEDPETMPVEPWYGLPEDERRSIERDADNQTAWANDQRLRRGETTDVDGDPWPASEPNDGEPR